MSKQRWYAAILLVIVMLILGARGGERGPSTTRPLPSTTRLLPLTTLPDGTVIAQPPGGELVGTWELVAIDGVTDRPIDYVTLTMGWTGELDMNDGCLQVAISASVGPFTETSVGVREATFVMNEAQDLPDLTACPPNPEREHLWTRLRNARAAKRHGDRLVLLDAQNQPLLQFNQRLYE